MIRLHPPVYALACVAVWCIQFVMDAVLLWDVSHSVSVSLRNWQIVDMACTLTLGALLLWQLPRLLQWRPRRHARPSPEVRNERERIARDLHDQVGSQLVTAMALLDARNPTHEPVRVALEQCMLDVRLLVDSMDGYDDTLADRLARLRHRIQPVMDRRGMELVWEVDARCAEHIPVGGSAMELTQAVREAVSNALQHSGATRLTVSLRHEAPSTIVGAAWHLRICDNGRGLGAAVVAGLQSDVSHAPLCAGRGQGLAGIQRRARSAGGWMSLEPGERGMSVGGLCVHITIPDPT